MFRFIFRKELKKMREEMEKVLERKAIDLEERVLLYTLGISPRKSQIRDHNTNKCNCNQDNVQVENSVS